jgi:fumarate reductase subunit C
MAGWWRRNPFFLRYMAREATALFVVIYAILVLFGVERLAQGRPAFTEWMHLMSSKPLVVLHAVLLAAFAYHTWTWFAIMPKTMPPVVVGGRRLTAGAITGAGLVAAAVLSALVVTAFVGSSQ